MDLESILAGVPSEGGEEQPDEQSGNGTEKETPSSSPEEKKQAAESPSQEGEESEEESKDKSEEEETPEEEEKKPLHKQKRWQRIYAENKDMRERLAEFEKAADARLSVVESKIPAATQAIPEWARRLVGDNQEAYQALLQGMDEVAKRHLTEREQREAAAAQEEAKRTSEARDYVQESVTELVERTGIDRNEFLKFMVDFKKDYGSLPVDSDDNINFDACYKLFQRFSADKEEQAKEKSKARKSVADFTSGQKKSSEPQNKEILTSADIAKAGGDWRNL